MALGLPVGDDEVGGEVVLAPDQRRADAVRVDRNAAALELLDLRDRESTRRDDPHLLVPGAVERGAHLADEALVDASRVEVAHLLPERAVDELAGRVEPNAPELRTERVRDRQSRGDRVVLEVDEHRDAEVVGRPLGELLRREHGVAAVGGDQRSAGRCRRRGRPTRRPARRR